MDCCKNIVFYFGTRSLLWTFFFLLIFYNFPINQFFPNIRNKAPTNKLIFKFNIISVKITPVPTVRVGDCQEIIYKN